MPNPPKLYTLNEVADRCGVTPNTVHRWVTDGKLTTLRLGHSKNAPHRVTEDTLNHFLGNRPTVTWPGDTPPDDDPWHIIAAFTRQIEARDTRIRELEAQLAHRAARPSLPTA